MQMLASYPVGLENGINNANFLGSGLEHNSCRAVAKKRTGSPVGIINYG